MPEASARGCDVSQTAARARYRNILIIYLFSDTAAARSAKRDAQGAKRAKRDEARAASFEAEGESHLKSGGHRGTSSPS